MTQFFGKYGKWMGIKYAEINPYSDKGLFLRRITTGSSQLSTVWGSIYLHGKQYN
jgi:hypothetical protein